MPSFAFKSTAQLFGVYKEDIFQFCYNLAQDHIAYFCSLVWPQPNSTILLGNYGFCISTATYFHSALPGNVELCSALQLKVSIFSVCNNFPWLNSLIASKGLLRCGIAHVSKCLWRKSWLKRSWTRAERQCIGWDVKRLWNFHLFSFDHIPSSLFCFYRPAQLQNANNLPVFVAIVF